VSEAVKRRLAGCALLVAIVIALGPTARSSGAESPPVPEILRTTLTNGLRVVVVRNPLAPVVTTQMNYLVGSNEAPVGFPGMAHAQEHMMFRGSPGLSAAQLAYVGAAMGGEFDADTQQTVTQYMFTVPAEDLDVALRIEAIRMGAVDDDAAAWRQERGAIEQEVAQDLSNPQYVLYTKLLDALFAGTPYARDALGTRASFDATTGAMLKAFHDTWYAPNNAILIVVGDVQPAATLARIEALFGTVPARTLPARSGVTLRPVVPRALALDTDLPYGLAVVAFRAPGFLDTDYAAARVLADVLSNPRGVLQKLVVEGKALDAGFSFDPLPEGGLVFAAAAFPQGQAPDSTMTALQATLKTVASRGVEADLVEAAKRRVVTHAELEKNSIPGLAAAWSEALAVQGRSSLDDEVAAIRRVSVDDVTRVAQRFLDPGRAVTAILTPKSSGQPVTTRRFGGKESFTPPNTKPVPLPAWAASAVRRLTVPTSAVRPVVSTLANGLRVIVQPESVSNTITVLGHVKNRPSLTVSAGQEGIDELLDGLFAFGTESLDRVAYQRALDVIGAEASAGADFSLAVLAENFERGVQLLADNELHPALPESAFGIVKTQLGARVAGRLQSADYQAQRALQRALVPPGDPTLREASVAAVSSLTLGDVRAYYRRVFRPDLTTIVVMGKVDVDDARAVIEKYFGGWTADGPRPPTELPPIRPNAPAVIHVPNSARVQDDVTLAETLELNRFAPDYYALELGNHVLGGGFYATRLYRDLRQNAGLVYFVDAALQMSATRGLYIVSYGCEPSDVARARGIVLQELRTLQTNAVPEDELRQAKAVLLRRIVLSESSVERIARGLSSRSTDGLPLDEPTRAAARYLALTGEDVRAAFARWIRPQDVVQVTEGPSPR
jgi:zinc protease